MAALLSELRGGSLILTFNRPDRANAFDLELLGELQNALIKAEGDPQVRCVVLEGAGKVFSAGQDITEMQPGQQVSYREHLIKTYIPLILHIRKMGKPVVAAVNGPCAGAALGVCLACDIRLAHARAYFVVGFGALGLAPDSGVSLLLPTLIGLGRAQARFYSNDRITARQALRWGMVDQVRGLGFGQLVRRVAGALAEGPAEAFSLGKQAFNQAVLPNLERALEAEGILQEQAGRSTEHRAAVAGFLAKRRARSG
jgi:2-(1,2-epoxy-1,2-dihydrophenyl)acetyl-CoA isomerase